jgi:hypothetical protein
VRFENVYSDDEMSFRFLHMKAKKQHTIAPPPVIPAITNGIEVPVTSAQLARHLQVTTRTIATWRLSGLIPYWRINARSFRYRISTVEKALENLR